MFMQCLLFISGIVIQNSSTLIRINAHLAQTLLLTCSISSEYIQAQIKQKNMHLLNLPTSLGFYQDDTQLAKNRIIFNILWFIFDSNLSYLYPDKSTYSLATIVYRGTCHSYTKFLSFRLYNTGVKQIVDDFDCRCF